MNTPSFEAYSSTDISLLAEWLASDTWPFHVRSSQTQEAYHQKILDGAIAGEDEQVFWIHVPSGRRSGLLRILDLNDPTPVIDLRLRSEFRRKGIGRAALLWLTQYVFETTPDKIRIEGHTREDNAGMRQVFKACGYVKEAHYRNAWPSENGTLYSSIGYGITRDDWANGEVSPVPWDDE